MNSAIPKYHETFNVILQLLRNNAVIKRRELIKAIIQNHYADLPTESSYADIAYDNSPNYFKNAFGDVHSYGSNICIAVGSFYERNKEINVIVFFYPPRYPAQCISVIIKTPAGFITQFICRIVLPEHYIP